MVGMMSWRTSDAIKSSPLIGRILYPVPYRPDLFEIDPFILGALREER